MEIRINFAENKKIEAILGDFVIKSDQPQTNDGDNSAPSPYDYFLASTAMCAGYFVKAYCDSRKISVEGIKLLQINSSDIDNKYKQIIEFKIEFPEGFSEKDKDGILRSINGCSVKKAIQQIPEFKVTAV
ncbi:MAG: OsmC family protein [Oligoflexia bacterium]|nr:OsmC family protein [Oligoflexia bacterium]